MKLPGYVRHVTDRPAGNPYEELISEIIAGKRSIEALRSVVQTNWRLHRRAFHIPAIPREDSDETPLSPGPHGRRNSGNFLSLCVSLGRFIQIRPSETARVPRDCVGGSFTGPIGEFRAGILRISGRSSFAGVSFGDVARGSDGRDPLGVASPPPLIPRLLQSSREFHLLIARVSRGTLFLDASWNSGPGLPLMRLYNELLNRRLLNRWHRRHLRQLG